MLISSDGYKKVRSEFPQVAFGQVEMTTARQGSAAKCKYSSACGFFELFLFFVTLLCNFLLCSARLALMSEVICMQTSTTSQEFSGVYCTWYFEKERAPQCFLVV